MSYPRLSREEFPELPETIQTEEEEQLVLEYMVFSGTKIDELKLKARNPLMCEEEKQRHARLVEMSLEKYDRICERFDDYRERERRERYG